MGAPAFPGKGADLLNKRENRLQPSETFLVAALLAAAGGFLDAYTYLCRGGVFANAQTGNLVLLAVRAAEGDWRAAAGYLVPIAAFFLGVLTAEWVKKSHHAAGRIHWRHTVLLAETAVLAGAACIPRGAWDGAVNILVSFVCALQVETFRKVRGNPFASTMCTGNLRSGAEALFHGLAGGERRLLGTSGCYFGVIACFLAGAALGGTLSPLAPQAAVLLAAAPLLAAFVLMCRRPEERRERSD